MKFPILNEVSASRQMVNTFLGLDHNPKIADGAFYEMENLTSDHFPELSPRRPRGEPQNVHALGIIAADIITTGDEETKIKTELCYADKNADGGTGVLKLGEDGATLPVSRATHKMLVKMGAYLLVFPDKLYINTLKPEEEPGSMEVIWKDLNGCVLSPCGADGGEGNDYVKIEGGGIEIGFTTGDGVTISNLRVCEQINGSTVIRYIGENYIVVDGSLDEKVTQEHSTSFDPITIARSVPDMDFVIECGNRLWGCRYGTNAAGDVVNEIYCSKLGDFKNWNVYQGLADDAWYTSVGSSGPFTGAITYMGNPLFFKENCLHKVYVSSTGAHQVVDTVCRGVQLHCGKSLAIVGETLYYKSSGGVMAYDGSFPRDISDPLGSYRYGGVTGGSGMMHNGQSIFAVGGACGDKYYLSVTDPENSPSAQDSVSHLFVYDSKRNMWHREDDLRLFHMCNVGQKLYGVDDAGKIVLLSGTDTGDPVSWYAITGDLGLESPDRKYINKITLRLEMESESELTIDVEYDHEGVWNTLCALYGDRLGSFPVSVQPRRCDHLRLRLSGKGNVKIYSLTKTVMGGSDEE